MKKMRAAAIAAILSSSSALALSCWMPPFDPGLSTSVRFEKKLEKVLSIGPIEFNGNESDYDYFVPSFEAMPTDGYMVSRMGKDQLSVRYVGQISEQYRIGPSFWSVPNHWGDMNAVQSLSPATAEILSPTMLRGINIAGGGKVLGPGGTPVFLCAGISSEGSWINEQGVNFEAAFPGELVPIGGSVIEQYSESASYRSTRLLFLHEEASGAYRIFSPHSTLPVSHEAPYASMGIGVIEEILYEVPRLKPGVFSIEYSDVSGTRLLIVGTRAGDGGTFAMRWDSYHLDNPIFSLPLDEQVTDILHDMTLIARDKYATSFYDLDGNYLFRLATGSFRYIHEYFDGTQWYSYFTRTIIVDKRDGPRSYSFDVFRCPTDKLSGLAD